MHKLTDLGIRSLKDPCRVGDGNGLFFEITPTGVKRWVYRYKIDGKGGRYTIGRYPELSLKEARGKHIEARDLVRQGLNPSKARRDEKQQNINKAKEERDKRSKSFEYVALEWIEQRRSSWSMVHVASVRQTLQNNVYEAIGATAIDCITPPEVLRVIRQIEGRGSLEIARKVLQRMTAIFRYAIQTGRATYNPAADMHGVLKARPVKHMPAVFGADLARLLQDIAKNSKLHMTTKLALQLTAVTACRSGEIRGARWDEIDLKKMEWSIPAERMKMKREHIVPLSKQAAAIIKRAGVLFGTEGLVFPSVRDPNKPMCDNAMSKALRDMGYKGKATPHGFRSSFSSMAYEKSKFPSEVIEKCLAHEEKNKIKGAYNRAEYLEQRRELMQWYGNELQKLEYGWEVLESPKVMIAS